MFQGSVHVTKGEHGALIEAAGGRWNAATWVDHTNFYETLPGHQLELALWLEAERLANLLPAMTQEKLDNQRDVVKNERRQNFDNQPYGSWDERLHRLLYPAGHPYSHSTIGSMEDLGAASLDDVNRFFATHYAPNNAVLSVAGDFEPDRALDMISRLFGPIPANPNIPPPPEMAVAETIGQEVREVVLDAVELPRVYLAYRIPPWGTPGFEPWDVMSDVLGAAHASRLYQRLVRDRRLAQDVAASVFPLAFGSAIFVAWATARPGIPREPIERALVEETAKLGDAGPTDEELERARSLYRTSEAADLEECTERAERLSMYAALFGEPERVNTDVRRYEAVTAAQIRQSWRRLGGADNRVVLTFLPKPAQDRNYRP
jgi:predicted Zn-dependent peptidase